MLIGSIKEIIRHPVKSFYGESVQATNVMEYGLYGDRSHAFSDETRPGKFLTITQFPEMARYKARFAGRERMDEYPRVEIVTPAGDVLQWGEDQLTEEIAAKSKRNVSPVVYSPFQVPIGPIEEEHLQLVTDASLAQLSKLCGQAKLNHRRFRPNLLIELKEKIPFIEEKWLGRRLKIGSEAEILLKRPCERCMIITVNPDCAIRDSALLQTVAQERKNRFGVYGSVLKTGEIQAGDDIFLLDEPLCFPAEPKKPFFR